ncbi:hypothetical protein V7201_06285 [Bacillus sp. JJ1122]|uniref:hypothetical protein n=1 Tax=Bacillus sp. JJ1122 TaxID=3122951 RepID=UPI003000F87D
MKGMIRVLIAMFIGLFFATATPMAAPPPTEVKERKDEAPLHLIGTVTADELFKDTSKSEQFPQQVRSMKLKVDRMIRVPSTEKEKTSIEVYYWYIPSWQAREYTGGERVDIAVGDIIEIWLVEGEYGWEPALGGNTVNHIKYAENREEPIPEPFLHSIERKTSSLLKENTEEIVLILLSLVLILIVIKARKSIK